MSNGVNCGDPRQHVLSHNQYRAFAFNQKIIWATTKEKVHWNIQKFRSSCACANYHPGLCSPFIHVVSNGSVSEQ